MSKREIKFRIWTGEKMCYSDNVWAGSHGTVELLNIYTGYEDSDEWENYKVMQYTGLTDKNGQEIYENDLLSFSGNMTADNTLGADPNGFIYDDDSIHKVVWDIDIAAWTLQFNDEEHWKYKRDTRGLMVNGNCEIAGNIYEDKHLIE